MYRTRAYLILAAVLCVASGPGYGATLVAHWTLDGDSLDSSGNNNNATKHGNVTYGPGMYGQAAQFHGNGDYLQVPNNPGIQLRSGQEYSVAAYVNAAGLGQQNVLIHGLGCSTWASWFLGVQGGEPDAALSPNKFVFGARSTGGSGYIGATGDAVAGEWVHLAATYDGTTLKLYVNGEEKGSAAAPLPYDSGESLYIGGDPGCNGRSWFVGQVDDVAIFSRAMTTDQVRQMASGVLPTWLKANKPSPADGTVGVAMPLFQWSKGDTALFHDVYMGTSPNLTAADLKSARSPVTMYYHVAGLVPGTTYYWRVDEIDKDGVTVYAGDTWSFVAQALTAYYPDPVDGATGASTSPTLTWMSGSGALQHHVYFGDNLDAVTQGTAETDEGKQAMAEAAFKPGTLESLTTYYWKVDEILLGDAVKAGPVWKFTTCLPVEDFESYTDDEGSRIYETWIDGYTNNTGSVVGYAQSPFAEQTIVHSGSQSMPFDYNNVNAPFYSEAYREFDIAQNWASDGVDTLVLYVRGALSNSPATLYVGIEDASKHIGIVAHPDPALMNAMKWTEWKIPLSSLGGVNLAKVKKMYLGAGDRQTPAKGGTGLIFIDDIGVTKP